MVWSKRINWRLWSRVKCGGVVVTMSQSMTMVCVEAQGGRGAGKGL